MIGDSPAGQCLVKKLGWTVSKGGINEQYNQELADACIRKADLSAAMAPVLHRACMRRRAAFHFLRREAG
jgi:hypothetical protein